MKLVQSQWTGKIWIYRCAALERKKINGVAPLAQAVFYFVFSRILVCCNISEGKIGPRCQTGMIKDALQVSKDGPEVCSLCPHLCFTITEKGHMIVPD